MLLQLRVLDGPDIGKTFELPESGTLKIGRASDTLTKLTDRTVSRYHCQIEVQGDRVVVTSSSESGTLVNDEQITQQELREQDVIRLGKASETRLILEPVDIHAGATLRGGAEKLQEAIAGELKGMLGKSLAHFRLDKIIAERSTRYVFLARDTKHSRDVALQVIAPGPADLRTLPQVFQMLRPVLGCQHPNLVGLYEAEQTGIHFWISMEYVEGDSLETHLAKAGLSGVIDWEHVVRIATQLAKGLDALHQRDIVHRNITPAHILVTRGDRQAKLGGLWRARTVRDCGAGGGDIQEVLGQVTYMPPERLRGGKPASMRSDIFSLGAVLYHLLAGRAPFLGNNDAELINQIIQAEPPSLRDFQFALPEGFEAVVKRMLAKAPEERFANAGELVSALQIVTASKRAAAASPAPERSVSPARERVPAETLDHPARVPAPAAAAPVAVTAPAPAPMPAPVEGKITVTCQCGQTLQARKQFAGTRVRCPCCGDFIDLPGRPQQEQRARPAWQQSPVAHPPRPFATSQTAETAPAKATPLPRQLLRILAVLILLIGTVLVFFSGMVFNSGSPSRPEKNKPATTSSGTPTPPPSGTQK